MTETARWKMIATIAVAFSFGNVFAIACGTGSGGNSANAGGLDPAADGTYPPSDDPAVAALQGDIASLRCFIGHMTDDERWFQGSDSSGDTSRWRSIEPNSSGYYGSTQWNQGPNSDSVKAYNDCF